MISAFVVLGGLEISLFFSSLLNLSFILSNHHLGFQGLNNNGNQRRLFKRRGRNQALQDPCPLPPQLNHSGVANADPKIVTGLNQIPGLDAKETRVNAFTA